MIFKKITIQNFMSIRDIRLDLDGQGLVSIQGLNRDNDSLNNNGAGKSSIIEALVYAVYGRTIRGIKTDDVVNKVANKNMKIFLDFVDDDGVEYRIARYRKHRVNKNKSIIYRNGTDITPKSEADFNKLVADLLQMDYLTFTSSVLYSAESFKFTSATDAEMKSTFDMMLGLDVFTKCLEITKSKLKKVEDEVSTGEWKIDSLQGQIEQLEEQIIEAEESSEAYHDSQEEKIEELKQSIKDSQAELKRYTAEKAKLEKSLGDREKAVKQAEEAYKKAKEKLSQIEELKQAVSEVNSEIKEAEREVRSCENEIETWNKTSSRQKKEKESLEKKIEKWESEKKDLDEDIGQPCPTCGQPMTEESIEPARQEYDERIKGAQADIKECEKTVKDCDSHVESLQKKIGELEESITEGKNDKQYYQKLIDKSQGLVDEEQKMSEAVDDAKEEKTEVEKQIYATDVHIESCETDISKTEKLLKQTQEETNPYDEIIERHRKQQEKHQASIDEIKESIQDKLEEKEGLLFWQEAYSNQGIKSFILDDITPFLNKRVNKYLKKLASNHIEVQFSTQSTLKSGEVREKFSLAINNEDGGSQYIANSSGEKRRIDLAVNLALQDLVSSRSSKKVNLAIFDEAFDALDDIGVERVVELLQELANEKSSIFVISHNNHLKSYFTNTITVVKKGGCATLSDGKVEEDEESEDE